MESKKTNANNSNLASREMMKQESIRRMAFLSINPSIIYIFDKEDTVSYSERIGYLFWATKYEDIIQSFEEKTGCLAYHLIYNETVYGRILSVLFVSKYKDDWEHENALLQDCTPYAWCYNLDIPEYSEFGAISVKSNIGGLIRYF